jgi:hypothetical protein
MKKPVLFFSIASDPANLKMAKDVKNSFRKFHKDIDFKVVTGSELESYTKDDKQFFYRATPIFGEEYLKEYDLVVKIDADSLVLGDLSYIWKTKDYDVATVINWNRYDPAKYGFVQFPGILPVEYMNAGLVCMRNPKFVHEWKMLTYTPQFYRLQMLEQDLLNIMVYYGNWNVRCLDHMDKIGGNEGWWGLIGKLEWSRAELRGDKLVVPKGFGETPFPPQDTELKVIHMGGGPVKEHWGKFFNTECMKRINYLISEVK